MHCVLMVTRGEWKNNATHFVAFLSAVIKMCAGYRQGYCMGVNNSQFIVCSLSATTGFPPPMLSGQTHTVPVCAEADEQLQKKWHPWMGLCDNACHYRGTRLLHSALSYSAFKVSCPVGCCYQQLVIDHYRRSPGSIHFKNTLARSSGLLFVDNELEGDLA